MLNSVKWGIFFFLLSPLLVVLFSGETKEIAKGFSAIFRHPGILITDYFAVGGVRAAICNATLVGLMGWLLFVVLARELRGSHVASLCTMVGFALFGKNILNILPILLGCFLFSKFSRQSFSHLLPTSLFATSLAPTVSLLAFQCGLRIEVALLGGILGGFLTLAVAQQTPFFHLGYNLYNVGFSGGIVGSLFASLLDGFGWSVEPSLTWAEGLPLPILVGVVAFLSALILLGLRSDPQVLTRWIAILSSSGKGPLDFFSSSPGGALVNMGVVGFMGLAYVLLVGGDLNGPTLGGILTMTGFAAYGKHPRNTIPVLFGVYLGTLVTPLKAHDPEPLLAALFSSALAPLAGELGILAGVLGGFLHLFLVTNIGVIHGGINLYNNGFAAGFVAITLTSIFGRLSLSGRQK